VSGAGDTNALLALPDRFTDLKVWVVGDLMIDEYVSGAVERISPEAPVPVVRAQGSEHRLGGAANVARQIEALARPRDVLMAFSTSGNSPNVVQAAQAARRVGCSVVAFTGARGGELAGHADVLLKAPSSTVARIQEVHTLCIHVLCESLDALIRAEQGS